MSSGWMDKSDAERNDVVLKVPGISLQVDINYCKNHPLVLTLIYSVPGLEKLTTANWSDVFSISGCIYGSWVLVIFSITNGSI